GWTAEITTVPLNPPITDDDNTTITQAPHVITWTAQPGVRLGPTEFGEFAVSMGPLPDNVDRLAFPAVQTYDDGHVVTWDQARTPGGPEPEHPAPTVALVSGPNEHGPGEHGDERGGEHGGHDDLSSAEHGAATTAGLGTAQRPDDSAGVDNTARWLGGIGLIL